ncbi:MAG: DUF4113 domain-containing protein [Candidatus Saccharibacteria bacterium]|nr:DUF4113 domain-containing protein [Moraxellaceae bacterium]
MSKICDASSYQGDLFAAAPEDSKMMTVLDKLNSKYSKGTVKLSQDGLRQS